MDTPRSVSAPDVAELAALVDRLREVISQQADELTRLGREVAGLRDRAVPPPGGSEEPGRATGEPPSSGGAGPSSGEPRIDRRALLRRAPHAAGAVGAGLLAAEAAAAPAAAAPAAAATGQPVLIGADNDANGKTTTMTGSRYGNITIMRIVGGEVEGAGAPALSVSGPTELIHTQSGAPAIHAQAAAPAPAVRATSTDVNRWGDGALIPGIGIQADAQAGTGVVARSQTGTALRAEGTSPATKADVAVVASSGTGRALVARCTNERNGAGAITAVHSGGGAAVHAVQQSKTAGSFAVIATAGTGSRGGRFEGGAAALHLVPSSSPAHPSTGLAGDLFVDAARRLWFCSESSSGAAAATWKQLA